MLNNLVNRHDAGRLYRRVSGRDVGAVVAKLRGDATERVVRQWSDTAPEPRQWWSIPAVRRRWNLMVSGDAAVDFPAMCAERHLAGRTGLRALSLGCGMGGRELRWAELGVFDRIDAVDISPAQVEVAATRAREGGHGDTVHARVGDVTDLRVDEPYDVVLAEHSLHHLEPMPEVVSRIHDLLRPDGLFLVDEFVGPQRFQWTDEQVDAAQDVLDRIPPEYRVIAPSVVKERIVRPSRLWMTLTDPSEACDSARIRSSLPDTFEVLDERPYGGAVLHLALADIAQNFLADDERANEVLAIAFAREDRLMAAGVVGSDFTTFVCRKASPAR
jgi:SAM-dependent methyltransferase